MSIIIVTIVFSAILAFVLGLALGFFQKKFKVERDPLADKVRDALPGANCGGCGFPGCDRTSAGLGWCKAHLKQHHAHGPDKMQPLGTPRRRRSTNPPKRQPARRCTFPGCDNPHRQPIVPSRSARSAPQPSNTG